MTTSAEHAAHCIVIKYFVDRGFTLIQNKKEMEQTKCCKNELHALVFKWRNFCFTNPDVNILENRGRPKKSRAAIAQKVDDVLDVDRHRTVRYTSQRVLNRKKWDHRLITDGSLFQGWFLEVFNKLAQ